MKKKYIAALLIFFLLIFEFVPAKRAEAILPLAIPAVAYWVVLSLAVSAGVVVSSQTESDYVVEKIWEDMTEGAKEKVMTITAIGAFSWVMIQDDVWTEIRDIVQAKWHEGENPAELDGATTTCTMYEAYQSNVQVIAPGMVEFAGNSYYLFKTVENGTLYMNVYKNGAEWQHVELVSGTAFYEPYITFDYLSTWHTCNVYLKYNNTGNTLAQDLAQSTSLVITSKIILGIGGEAVLGNPGWDWLNDKTGDKRIPLPSGVLSDPTTAVEGALDSIYEKTYHDVIAGNIGATTSTNVDTATEVGLLTGVWQGINGLVASITGFFDPTIPIDFEPIKTVGTGFTTVFPFSLPWDLYRSFSSLNSSSWNGKVPISAHSPLANFDFEIDFSMFSGILSVIRVFELVAFDVALILSTRRLLGGAQ